MNENDGAEAMNYETHVVTYWLSDDLETRRDWCRRARQHLERDSASPNCSSNSWTEYEDAQFSLAHELRCHLFAECDSLKHSNVYSDLMLGALGEVKWEQVADYFLRESRAASQPATEG